MKLKCSVFTEFLRKNIYNHQHRVAGLGNAGTCVFVAKRGQVSWTDQ
jgi:hypothetical protein